MERLGYHTIEELQALSLQELQALWELVPTDRQKAYRAAYDREVRNAGAIGSDELEGRVAAELLTRYQEGALVPIGTRWARTPQRVQDAARTDSLPADEDTAPGGKVSPKVLLGMGGGVILLLLILFLRLSSGGSDDGEVTLTPEVSSTPTPQVSPTPTPLALEAQDDVITGGDSERDVAYPVNLQVILPNGEASPKVWVVQRRAVRAAEWRYDENPDVASFINGMSVRPVIGIPWSEENAAWFERMEAGTVFNLTMNTGAILRYEFVERTDVRRSETGIFRQVSPGLVLLLIGEVDADGLPTATRTLITAHYPPDQELTRGGVLLGGRAEGEIGDSLPLGDATVTLRDVVMDGAYRVFDLLVEAGDEAITQLQVLLEDGSGARAFPLDAPPEMIPGRAVIPLRLAFDSPLDGRLILRDARGESVAFRVEREDDIADVPEEQLDVQLISVLTEPGRITTHLRIYNAGVAVVTFTPDDIWLALGYAPNPAGPRTPAAGLTPFDLLPEQAVDLKLVWYWADEPYAALQVGAWRWMFSSGRTG